MKQQNQFTVIAYLPENGKFFKMKYANNIGKCATWIWENIGHWKHLNVYDRKKGNFIKRFYPTDKIGRLPN